MKHTAATLALSGLLAFTAVGCAVTRDQSTVGEYVDDATITTRVKAKFAEDPTVSAMAISVETYGAAVRLCQEHRRAQPRGRDRAHHAGRQGGEERHRDPALSARHGPRAKRGPAIAPDSHAGVD